MINLKIKKIPKKYSDQIKVSVIIVSYNHEKYIEQAIESVLSQKCNFAYEVIISDDGSIDRTHDIIKKYVARFPKIFIDISKKKNVNISNNYKSCIKKAKGKYISVLEGDDYYLGNRLQEHFLFLENNKDCKMVFSRINILNEDNQKKTELKKISILNKLNYDDFFREKYKNIIINMSSCTFSSSILKKIPNIIYSENLSEVTLSCYFLRFGKIGYISDIHSVYRVHNSGAWSGLNNLQKKYNAHKLRILAKKFLPKRYKIMI